MRKKIELGVREGEVYAGKLKNGMFGAVHVVKYVKDGQRPGRDSAVIVCTKYMAQRPPAVDDPTLRQVVYIEREMGEPDPCIMIVDTPPPSDMVLVGTVPVTPEERGIPVRGRYGSGWTIVHNVLSAWRWKHEREAVRREIEEFRRRAGVRTDPGPRKPLRGSRLTEEQFWKLLDTVRPDGGDDPRAVQPLIEALSRRSLKDIREFEEILSEKLYRLDARRFAERAGKMGASDDGFLYARCSVVAKGRAFYEKVLRRPDDFPPDGDLEVLLTVAPEAYRRRCGEDFEHSTHYSYETGSNAAGWPSTKS